MSEALSTPLQCRRHSTLSHYPVMEMLTPSSEEKVRARQADEGRVRAPRQAGGRAGRAGGFGPARRAVRERRGAVSTGFGGGRDKDFLPQWRKGFQRVAVLDRGQREAGFGADNRRPPLAITDDGLLSGRQRCCEGVRVGAWISQALGFVGC